MKKAVFTFIVLAAVFLVVMGSAVQAQTVTQWGSTARGNAWPILNTASTTAGTGSMGASAAPTGWATIMGGFTTVSPTTTQALVATGTFEFVGGGATNNPYTWLRYALFYQDSIVLSNANTTTAAWTGKNCWGYEFTPVSGGGTISNTYNSWPTGNQGTEWVINNSGAWNSTNTNNGGPYSTILQAPYHQSAPAAVYDWAISVQPQSNGYNEVRWYFVQQHTAGSTNYYWWGGSFIDSSKVTTKFNAIGFACNNDVDATCKQVNLANVKVALGSPITVPEAPFQPVYPSAWGSSPNGRGNAWPILNDSTYLIGDGAMGSTAAPTGWATILGGFGQNISPTSTKAMVVTGTFEFVGGGATNSPYTWLRYALFYEDSLVLSNQNKTTASWAGKNCWGYEFTPVSGGGTISNTYNAWPTGTQGTEWVINNSGAWNSTNTNNGGPFSTVLQVPHNQSAPAAVYDWAISVQPIGGGRTEVRWYFIQQHAAGTNNYYWWGGSFVDSSTVTTKFNAIAFGCNNDLDATCKRVNIRNVKIDLGTPITVPTPPWVAYYVDKWGIIGGRMYGWSYIPDPAGLIGNAGIGGSAPNGKWAALRGGFDPVIPTTAKALVLTGKVVFAGGGFTAPNSFRFGTFYSDLAGKVILDSSKATLPDSTRWDGLETYTSGYLFIPPSGTNGLASWPGLNTTASSGGVVNGAWLQNDYPAAGPTQMTWNYALGKDVQTPANAVAGAGTYNFTISVAALATGGNDVRWKLAKSDNSYSITGKLIDTQSPLAATKFNSVNFAIAGGQPTTAMNLTDVKVDYVDVATVPITSALMGTTAVQELGGSVPMSFTLHQNYPNPFNPSTTIRYDVAKPAYVTIRIYDVLGRMVSQLVDGVQSPSAYSVQWNPAGLSSGTYLCRIEALNQDGSGKFTAVSKLLYMK
ncbi:MAG TPA: T9SS type A sorting domain-containing protein [Bacteroidota bacterium]|nr:T9SS type A sorting domain-containing protein [Bacteroidota bacterium]